MLDVEMLAQLARPFGTPAGNPRPDLETVFARVVADGWEPRSPAYGAELDHLEVSTVRGDCISPLLQPGDTVYIDHNAPALPGDLASFALSSRGVEAQNSSLPDGQQPWRIGDRWIKLFADYRGLPMLLDRYGSSAAATMMACDSPDATPILHPVRNVRRNGHLLFAPDTHSAQIGLNAATITFVTGSNTVTTAALAGGSGHNPITTLSTTPPVVEAIVIVTITMNCYQSDGSAGDVLLEVAYDDTGTGGAYQYGTTQVPLTLSTAYYALQWEFSHSSSNTAGLAAISLNNTSASPRHVPWSAFTIQAELIKR